MTTQILRFFSVLTVFVLAFGLVACGEENDGETTVIFTDDDDDSTDDDSGDDDTGDDDVGGDDDTGDDDTGDDDVDPGDPPTDAITVYVFDFGTRQAIAGVTCELISAVTAGSFDPPVTTTSDVDGMCAFNQTAKDGVFNIKFTKANYVETYAFNSATDIEWYFPIATNATRQNVATLLGVSLDPTKGIAAGAVQWYSDTEVLEEVGCATVTSSGGDTVKYVGASGLPDPGRVSTHPDHGYYLAMNVAPGAYTYTADADGATATGHFPHVIADAITYVNIVYAYAQYPANPTPAGCSK